MVWWLRRFTRQSSRTSEQLRAAFLALPLNQPAKGPGSNVDVDQPEHCLEAICDGNQIDADKAAWEALLNALDEALSEAEAGEVDGVMDKGDDEASVICYGPDASRMFTATEALLRAYQPCLRVELRYGEPDDDAAETRVIPVNG